MCFPFHLRIPDWCSAFTLKIDGRVIPLEKSGSVLTLQHEWHCNTVEITFRQDIRIRRWTRNGNCATLSRGPLDYSLAIRERRISHPVNGFTGYQVRPQTPWNYALELPTSHAVHVLETHTGADQPWTPEHAPITLSVKGRRLSSWQIRQHTIDPVPPSPVHCTAPAEELHLIPMGCARLRIACFPVAEE